MNIKKGSLKRPYRPHSDSENHPEKARPAKYPIFLSAVVYPGAGQIFQHRIIAGIFFIITFTILFISFMFLMGSIIIDFYSLGLNFDNAEVNAEPSLTPALLAFGGALMIYIINLIDTHAAYRRKLNESKRKIDIEALINNV